MSLPVLMRAALPRIGSLVSAAPAVIEGVARRIGSPGATAARILELAKNNKLVTFAVLYEMYGAADDLVKKFLKSDESLRSIVGLFDQQPDEPDVEASHKNDKMEDEFEIISDAVRQVGGLDRLLVLRRAMALSGPTYELYQRRAQLGRRLAL